MVVELDLDFLVGFWTSEFVVRLRFSLGLGEVVWTVALRVMVVCFGIVAGLAGVAVLDDAFGGDDGKFWREV